MKCKDIWSLFGFRLDQTESETVKWIKKQKKSIERQRGARRECVCENRNRHTVSEVGERHTVKTWREREREREGGAERTAPLFKNPHSSSQS